MRKDLYRTLDDAYHDKEMKLFVNNKDWHCHLVMDEHDELIGLVELSSRNIVDGCLSSPVAYLEGLYLKPEYRQQGLGKEVLKHIMAWCASQGYSELATDTELENINAQGFYKATGFQETYRIVEFRIDVMEK